MKIFKVTVFFLVFFVKPVFADQLFVNSDLHIVDGYYSGNANSGGYQCGICVMSNNAGQPWDVAVTGSINAYNNRVGIWVNSSGNALFRSFDSNDELRLFLDSDGDAAISNEGGKLIIDGGTAGGYLDVSNIYYDGVVSLQNFGTGGNTLIKNMDIYANSSFGNSYVIGVNNQATYRFSSDMDNTLLFYKNYSDNWSAGLYSASKTHSPTSKFELVGMNLEFTSNVAQGGVNYGIATAEMDLFGTEQGNTYNYSWNRASKLGAALYVWSGGSNVNVKNMDMIVEGNSASQFAGIYLGSGSSLKIEGNENSGQLHFLKNKTNTNDFSGIVALANTDVFFKNVDILIKENESAFDVASIYLINGGQIINQEIQNRKIEILDNQAARGFYGIISGEALTVENMDVYISGNIADTPSSFGLYTQGETIFRSLSRGKMFFSDLDTVWFAEGNVENMVENYDISAENITQFIDANDGADLLFRNSNVVLEDGMGLLMRASLPEISEVRFEGSQFNVKSEKFLSVQGVATVNLSATSSEIIGNIDKGSTSVVNYSLLNGSLWKTNSSSSLNDVVLNDSIIDMRSVDGDNTLNVENYSASNGQIKLTSYLNLAEDKSDRLVISQVSSGSTTLNIQAMGDDESNALESDGILVVQQDGASVSSTFSLHGGVIDSGFYEYHLVKGDVNGVGDNYYLRTSVKPEPTPEDPDPEPTPPDVSPVGKMVIDVPSVHLSSVKFGMNELRKRLGELRDDNPVSKSGTWVRTYTQNLEIGDASKAKMNLFGIEGGYDYKVYASAFNQIYLGVMLGYQYTNDIKILQHNQKEGSGKITSPSFGAYATWLNQNGYFTDFALRHFISDMKIKNITSQDDIVSYNSKRGYTAFDLEFGKRWTFMLNAQDKVIFEPKAMFEYIYSKSDKFTTNYGGSGSYSHTISKVLKNALTVYYHTELSPQTILEPFVQLGVAHEFDGKSEVEMNSVEALSSAKGTSFEVGGGLNMKLDERWNLYSDLMYQKSSIVKSISTNLGVRYNF
ncbi:MAG: autotransporter outer membrane beta-barrel domain-containing protein [Alphaproteobacteria bacterium]|nr:autotransporter outer membrane beta-barrel domain-containing protein [Alphaproteobacteria bacterium]